MEETKTQEKKVKVLKYYAWKRKEYGFSIEVYDDNGKPVPVKDAQGSDRYFKGKKINQTMVVNFNPVVQVAKHIRYCVIDTNDKQIISMNEPTRKACILGLETLAKDGQSCVITEKEFNTRVNPAAAKIKEEAEELTNRNYLLAEENKKLQAELATIKQSHNQNQNPQQRRQ
ncbi:MAG: hypothetical protein EHM12_11360 [Dehalococcoidia bacterium]|nr:MAG: hypothetical protein EHM12_11360 [Dehalococcoidia bacterium]